jgi:hypothetical protein
MNSVTPCVLAVALTSLQKSSLAVIPSSESNVGSRVELSLCFDNVILIFEMSLQISSAKLCMVSENPKPLL